MEATRIGMLLSKTNQEVRLLPLLTKFKRKDVMLEALRTLNLLLLMLGALRDLQRSLFGKVLYLKKS